MVSEKYDDLAKDPAYRVGFFGHASKDIPERVNRMMQEMIGAAEEIERLRERLAEAEALLRSIRASVGNPDPMDDWDKKIDAFLSGGGE